VKLSLVTNDPIAVNVLRLLGYKNVEIDNSLLNVHRKKYKLKDADHLIVIGNPPYNDTTSKNKKSGRNAKQKTPFPIVAALYLRNSEGMRYEYIYNFEFDILNSDDKYILKNYETIDGYIRKYPPTQKDKNLKSDIGLYMHNIRDTNSLITNGYLTEKFDPSRYITINFNDLYKYAYLNCMRRYFLKDFKFGNLSPIVNKSGLEKDEYLQDLCIIDTICNNQKLMVFNVDNKSGIIWTRHLYEKYLGEKDKCLRKINCLKLCAMR